MRVCRLFVMVILSLLIPLTQADAQTCSGLAPFSAGPWQAQAGGTFSDNANGFVAAIGAGRHDLYGRFGLGVLSFDDLDESATFIAGTLGTEFPVDTDRRVFVCPEGTISYGFGPDFDSLSINTLGLQAGARVGFAAGGTDRVSVVPTAGLAVVYQRVTADFNGSDESDSDTYGIADLGVGIIFNRRFAIQPSLSFPFGVDDSDVAFTLLFSFNFGR